MAQLRRSADLREVIDKIDRLERMAESGELPDTVPGDGAAPGDAASSPEDAPSPPETSEDPESESSKESADAAAEPVPDYMSESDVVPTPSEEASSDPEASGEESTDEDSPEPEVGESNEEDGATEETDEPDDRGGTRAQEGPDPDPNPDADPSVEYDDLFGTPALQSDEPPDTNEDTDATGGHASADDAKGTRDGTAQAATVAEPAVATAAPDDGLVKKWPRVVEAVKEEHISLGSLLSEAEPVECAKGTLTVAVPRDLHRESLRDRKRVLLRHLTATVEQPVEDLRFVVESTSDNAGGGANASDEPLSPREQLQQLRDTYPALDVLFTDFGAEPVW
jgi:DNA polymerase-3 subunit gamma/tau